MSKGSILIMCPSCRRFHPYNRARCTGFDKIRGVPTGCGQNLRALPLRDWWIRFYVNGVKKHKRVGLYPNRMAAEAELTRTLAAITEGKYFRHAKGETVTLGRLRTWYLGLDSVKSRGDRALKTLTANLTAAVDGVGRDVTVAALARDMEEAAATGAKSLVRQYQDRRLAQGRSSGTVNREIANLKAMLGRAVKERQIDSNPLEGFALLKEPKARERVVYPEEELALYRASGDHEQVRDMMILARYTGMRWSEVVFLTWEEVDLSGPVIRLSAARTKEGKPKVIPLVIQGRGGAISHALEAITRQQRGFGTTNVFLHGGKPYTSLNGPRSAIASIVKAAGVLDFHFHDLRGTFIVWMEQHLRYSERQIMAITGHSPASRRRGFDAYQNDQAAMAMSVMGGAGQGGGRWELDAVEVYFRERREVG